MEIQTRNTSKHAFEWTNPAEAFCKICGMKTAIKKVGRIGGSVQAYLIKPGEKWQREMPTCKATG